MFIKINKNVFKVNIDTILYVSFLLTTTSFFFFDSIRSLQTLFSLLVALAILSRRKLQFATILLPLFLIVLFINGIKILNIENYGLVGAASPSGLNILIFFSCLITEKPSFIYKIFDFYLKIFIFMNSFSIFYYINILFNWGAAYEIINLGGRGFIYRNYSNLAIFTDYTIYNFGSFTISRLGGMFEEPGMLGTYAGVLLVADIIAFPNRKFTKFILAIFGILSISFAFAIFILFIGCYYLATIKFQRKKTIITFIIAIILITGITRAVPEEIRIGYDILLFDRFSLENGQLVGDNRDPYKQQFEKYLQKATILQLALGNGIGSNQQSAEASYSSYHKYLYELGFLGFSLLLLYPIYFLVYIPCKFKKFRYLPLTVVCGLSLYQRPDFLSSHYFILYAIILFVLGKRYKFNMLK